MDVPVLGLPGRLAKERRRDKPSERCATVAHTRLERSSSPKGVSYQLLRVPLFPAQQAMKLDTRLTSPTLLTSFPHFVSAARLVSSLQLPFNDRYSSSMSHRAPKAGTRAPLQPPAASAPRQSTDKRKPVVKAIKAVLGKLEAAQIPEDDNGGELPVLLHDNPS